MTTKQAQQKDDPVVGPTVVLPAPVDAHVLSAGFVITLQSLELWRRLLDTARDMIRTQQDTALDIIGSQLHVLDERAQSNDATAPAFATPMLAWAKAYEQVGGAFIAVQRSALSSLNA